MVILGIKKDTFRESYLSLLTEAYISLFCNRHRYSLKYQTWCPSDTVSFPLLYGNVVLAYCGSEIFLSFCILQNLIPSQRFFDNRRIILTLDFYELKNNILRDFQVFLAFFDIFIPKDAWIFKPHPFVWQKLTLVFSKRVTVSL